MTTARPRRIQGPLILLGLVALVITLVVTTVVLPTLAFPPRAPHLDDHGELPPFELVDNTGAALTNDSLRGHVTIVDFIFTRCDSICSALSSTMYTVQERTGDEPSIKFLSISVDPAHDTAAVLDAYATRFRADPTRWRFARAELPMLTRLVEGGMKVGFADRGDKTASGAPNIAHDGHFVLLDQDLHVRGFYSADDVPEVEKLMKHARYLTRKGPSAGR